MNTRLLLMLLIADAVALAGCQGPAPLAAGARYPQRDLTVLWPERHYWPVPPSGFLATPTAADETAGRAPDAQPAAQLTPPVPWTRLGRVPHTACAARGC